MRPSAARPFDDRDLPSDAADLAQVAAAVRRRWRWIALPTLITFTVALAFVTTVTPRYTGEAKILLESRDSFYTRPAPDRPEQQTQIDEQAVASQVQVAMSRDLAREAIKRLNLVGNEEFDPAVGGLNPVKQLLVLVGLSKNPLEKNPEDRILETYYDRLLVYQVGKSRVLAVEFKSKDPELAARGANAVAEIYLELQEAAKNDTARSASTWLGTSIDGLRGKVAEAEAKVEAFRSRSGLLVGANNATITSQQLAELTTQLGQARTQQADGQAKAKLIREMIKAGRAFEIPDVANNELIRRLVEQRVTFKGQLALELRTLLPEHPRIKELNAQIADLDQQLRSASERTARTLENDATIAGSRVESLQAAIDAQKTQVARANESEVQLRALEREARTLREQLESYLTRFRDASARDGGNATPADARIVSRAVVPQLPSFPRKGPIVALSTIAVFVLSLGAVVGRELLADQSGRPVARRREEVVADDEPEEAPATVRPVLGPVLVDEPLRPTFDPVADEAPPEAPREEPAQVGRFNLPALVRRLDGPSPEGRGRIVLVTGQDGPEQARDLAEQLARSLAGEASAVLVALDANEADAEDQLGWTDLIAGEVSFPEVLQQDPGSGLHVVPPGTIDGSVLIEDWEGVAIALDALAETYAHTLCLLNDCADATLLALAAPRVDVVVVATTASQDDETLVALYEALKGVGAKEVVIAREATESAALAAA